MENEKVYEVALVRTDGQDVLYIDGEQVSHDGTYDLPEYTNGKVVRLNFRYRNKSDQKWEATKGGLPENLQELLDFEDDNR